MLTIKQALHAVGRDTYVYTPYGEVATVCCFDGRKQRLHVETACGRTWYPLTRLSPSRDLAFYVS